MQVSAGLLASIKNRLNITWEDVATDNKISDIAEEGIFYLDGKLGAAGNYEIPGWPRMLLMEYVRYARDEALDVFENNYTSLILSMQNERAVSAYVEKTEPSE